MTATLHVGVDSCTQRLVICVAGSLLIHCVTLLGTGLDSKRYQRAAPLTVTLDTVLPTVTPHTTTTETSSDPPPKTDTTPQPLPASPNTEVAQPQITPPRNHQPVDVPKLLNLPADIYFASSEVDVRAEPLNEVDLVYPVIAYQHRTFGTVRLNIFVNEQGDIDKVVVVDAQPAGVFEEAALQAVDKLRFSPAIKNGVPVKNRKTIEIKFDPYEKINTP